MPAPAWLDADWPAPPGVRAVTSLRSGDGVSQPPFDRLNLGMNSGDDPAAVRENRRRLRAWLGLPGEPVWLRQVHGTGVVRLHANPGPEAGEGIEADASVTSDPNTVLAILTADCLPVVFAAADGSEIAAAHAGWRGLAAGVLEATVAAMATPPPHLQAWLGPAAGPKHYEIGAEVRDAFVARDPGASSAFLPTRPGHWHADLYALARRRLVAAGVPAIYGGGLCTIADPARFFSHRRDARTGRLVTLAWRGRN